MSCTFLSSTQLSSTTTCMPVHISSAVRGCRQALLCRLALQAEESSAAAEQRLQELTAQMGAMQHEMQRQKIAASSARQLQAQLEEVCGPFMPMCAMCNSLRIIDHQAAC